MMCAPRALQWWAYSSLPSPQLQITHVQVSSQCYPHGEALALEKYTAAITGVAVGAVGQNTNLHF